MIVNIDFLFLEVVHHFGNLFFGVCLFISFPFLGHFQDLDFVDMIIIIKIIFGAVDGVRFIFDEDDTSADDFIISVFVYFSGLLSYFLDSFQKTIMITVRVEVYDSHAAIDFDELLPMGQFARTVVLNCLEFIGISVSSLEFIASVFVEIAVFFDSEFFEVLNRE